MGRAYECDRCDSLFSGQSPNGLQVRNNSTLNVESGNDGRYIPERNIDLCPECSEQLEQWIEGDRFALKWNTNNE